MKAEEPERGAEPLPHTHDPADPDESEFDFEPLPEDWDEEAARYGESFISAKILSSAERDLLTRFSHLCLRFAHAEALIQGEVLCEIPVHRSILSGERFPDLAAEAEQMAAVERRNLRVPDGPLEEIAEALDERGIKVIQWPALDERRAGAFLFLPRTGPALLSLAEPGSPEARFIIAHEYGHLIADIDPYESRFCGHGAAGLGADLRTGGRVADEAQDEPLDDLALAETRADLFARALLLPSPHIVQTLREFGIRLGRRLDLARLADLAFYYGVEVQVVLYRMADLGLISADDARSLAAECPPAREMESAATPTAPGSSSPGTSPAPEAESPADALSPSTPPPPGVPARFAHLCLALFLRREVSLDQLATLLGIDRAAARGFLAVSEAAPVLADPESMPPELRELWRRRDG